MDRTIKNICLILQQPLAVLRSILEPIKYLQIMKKTGNCSKQ